MEGLTQVAEGIAQHPSRTGRGASPPRHLGSWPSFSDGNRGWEGGDHEMSQVTGSRRGSTRQGVRHRAGSAPLRPSHPVLPQRAEGTGWGSPQVWGPVSAALQPCLPLSLAAKRRKARALLGSSLFLMVLCVPSTVSHVPAVLNVYVCKRDGNDRRCNSGESSGELAYWGDSVSDESPEWAGDPEGQPGGPPEKDLAGSGGEGGWSAGLPCGHG